MLKKLPQLSIAKNLLKKQVLLANNFFSKYFNNLIKKNDSVNTSESYKDSNYLFSNTFQKSSVPQSDLLEQVTLYEKKRDELLVKNEITYSVIVCLLFIFLYVVNSFFVLRNNGLFNELNDNVSRLSQLSNTENLYIYVSESVSRYSELQNNSNKLHESLDIVLSGIPSEIKIDDITIDSRGFQIIVNSNLIIGFSQLLSNYLDSPKISSINLKSVSLNYDSNDNPYYRLLISGEFND